MRELLMMSFQNDPLWMTGALAFSLLPLMGVLLSAIRHPKEEWWFHLLLPMVASIFLMTSWIFPIIHQELVAYRSDWSWVYLAQHPGMTQLMTLWFFSALLMYSYSLVTFALMGCWSVLTLRLDRLVTFFRRSTALLTAPLFFSVLLVLSLVSFQSILSGFSFPEMRAGVQLGLFLFALHSFLYSVDSAVFFRPRQLFRFCLVSGMTLVLCAQLVMLGEHLLLQSFDAKSLFAQSMLQFFLGVLVSAYYSAAFVQARFASHAYVQVFLQRLSPIQNALMMIFLSPQERTFIGQTMAKGIVVSFVTGGILLSVCFNEMYLVAVPLVFFGYFLMFYALDWQFDLLEKGYMVRERSESLDVVSRNLVSDWQYQDDDMIELTSASY